MTEQTPVRATIFLEVQLEAPTIKELTNKILKIQDENIGEHFSHLFN